MKKEKTRKRNTRRKPKKSIKKDTLDKKYLMCINKLSKDYKGDEKYAICRYSIYSNKRNIKPRKIS